MLFYKIVANIKKHTACLQLCPQSYWGYWNHFLFQNDYYRRGVGLQGVSGGPGIADLDLLSDKGIREAYESSFQIVYRISVFAFSSVSASFAGLSHLILFILGKRSAIPDLCLELGCALSKANSTTKVFCTSRTGPNRLIVLLLTHLSNFCSSKSVNPEYALPIGKISLSSQIPKVKSE